MIRPGYRRVTDVLYPFSGLTYINRAILDAAANRGSIVHAACEAKIRKLGEFIKPEFKGYLDSFNKWYGEQTFIERPDRFYCDKYRITGECDALYVNDTGFTLVDFKTSAKESKTWKLQGSAYSYLAKLEGYPITRIEFVKLSKDGKDPIIYEYAEDMPKFINYLEIYEEHFAKMTPQEVLEYVL